MICTSIYKYVSIILILCNQDPVQRCVKRIYRCASHGMFQLVIVQLSTFSFTCPTNQRRAFEYSKFGFRVSDLRFSVLKITNVAYKFLGQHFLDLVESCWKNIKVSFIGFYVFRSWDSIQDFLLAPILLKVLSCPKYEYFSQQEFQP